MRFRTGVWVSENPSNIWGLYVQMRFTHATDLSLWRVVSPYAHGSGFPRNVPLIRDSPPRLSRLPSIPILTHLEQCSQWLHCPSLLPTVRPGMYILGVDKICTKQSLKASFWCTPDADVGLRHVVHAAGGPCGGPGLACSGRGSQPQNRWLEQNAASFYRLSFAGSQGITKSFGNEAMSLREQTRHGW